MKKGTLALVLIFFLTSASYSKHQPVTKKIPLHLRTYLTPSIPKELYDLIASYINKTTNLQLSLSVEHEHSGPPRDQPDPFLSEEIDLGHLCSPPYIWLISNDNPSVELFPLVPVFYDKRTNGRPVYFSDVIVAATSPVKTFNDLRGKTWCYNDPESLSGYFCMLQKLAEMEETTNFFNQIHQSGSHLNSIQLVAQGTIDGSAIDSNVLALQLKQHPELTSKIRVIESWGPFPIQPIIVRKGLSLQVKQTLVNALQQMVHDEQQALAEFLVEGFGTIIEQDFDYEKTLLTRCQQVTNHKKERETYRDKNTNHHNSTFNTTCMRFF